MIIMITHNKKSLTWCTQMLNLDASPEATLAATGAFVLKATTRDTRADTPKTEN
jgi:hypothetical protein